MPTLRSHMKKSRCELHDKPQTMLGTIVNAQVEEDLRNDILKHLNDEDDMSTCLVSKGAYTLHCPALLSWPPGPRQQVTTF